MATQNVDKERQIKVKMLVADMELKSCLFPAYKPEIVRIALAGEAKEIEEYLNRIIRNAQYTLALIKANT